MNMFIINLSYIKELSHVDQYLEAHKSFLDTYYKSGVFINWGRKNPRTGGIIIANGVSKAELEKIVNQDPFIENNIAVYEIIEFIPTKTFDIT